MPHPVVFPLRFARALHGRTQSGLSLIVVLLILVVVSILGVAGIQISVLGERATRNDRDIQIAWQGAEAGLMDAQLDMQGQYAASLPADNVQQRVKLFKRDAPDITALGAGCGSTAATRGLCLSIPGVAPDWLTADFTDTGASASTVAFGTYTGRSFTAGTTGLQPATPPRYIMELVEDPAYAGMASQTAKRYIYRITSMGTGPNANTRVVVQITYRK